ncbi:MAG: hypothetical protein QG635_695 [Bacteroidota bacterium]|nr:hypothetical protein [Bacteroidota bacterium]
MITIPSALAEKHKIKLKKLLGKFGAARFIKPDGSIFILMSQKFSDSNQLDIDSVELDELTEKILEILNENETK